MRPPSLKSATLDPSPLELSTLLTQALRADDFGAMLDTCEALLCPPIEDGMDLGRWIKFRIGSGETGLMARIRATLVRCLDARPTCMPVRTIGGMHHCYTCGFSMHDPDLARGPYIGTPRRIIKGHIAHFAQARRIADLACLLPNPHPMACSLCGKVSPVNPMSPESGHPSGIVTCDHHSVHRAKPAPTHRLRIYVDAFALADYAWWDGMKHKLRQSIRTINRVGYPHSFTFVDPDHPPGMATATVCKSGLIECRETCPPLPRLGVAP